MKYYFAPLEGITSCYFRNVYDKHFKGIDKYYIPFLAPVNHTLSTKSLREINPSNNHLSKQLVPQIISKDVEQTLWCIDYLKSLGYQEVNLNLGCPSPTVINKGRGAGLLGDLNVLDEYLKGVFEKASLPISIKLRIGLKENNFVDIIKILNKYQILELIVHPRTAKDKYTPGTLNLEAIDSLDKLTTIPIIYNGDIKTKEDIEYIKKRFPYIKGIMLGRGIVQHPDILEDLDDDTRINKIANYFKELYQISLSNFGWNNTKYYGKEIWSLLIDSFDIPKDLQKRLFNSTKEYEFNSAFEEILSTCKINHFVKNGIVDIYN